MYNEPDHQLLWVTCGFGFRTTGRNRYPLVMSLSIILVPKGSLEVSKFWRFSNGELTFALLGVGGAGC